MRNFAGWAAVVAASIWCTAAEGSPGTTVCGSGAQAAVCFGHFDVPDRQAADFAKAGQATIDAIYSLGFERDLAFFIAHYTSTGSHAAAWKGVVAETSIAGMKAALPGQAVATYGGFGGWFRHVFFHNMAYDGRPGDPIMLNRAALPRPVPSLANTLAHELAHRAGLTHPSSGRDLDIAACEPPYVIGALIEKRILGSKWEASDFCPQLADIPTN